MHQYGFRRNHSTAYAALYIVDDLNYKMGQNRPLMNFDWNLSNDVVIFIVLELRQ